MVERLIWDQKAVSSNLTTQTISVVLWEVLLLVVIKSPYATVNGSNSTGKLTIEVSHGESVPIRCSAHYILLVLDGIEGAPYKRVHIVQLYGGVPYARVAELA